MRRAQTAPGAGNRRAEKRQMLRMAGSRRFLTLILAAAALGLAGCDDIDSAMFGSSDSDQSQAAAPADTSATPGTLPDTTPGPSGASMPGTLPVSSSAVSAGPGVTVTPVTIEPGSDTGTAVGQKVAQLRSDVAGLEDKIVAFAQQLADLRQQAAQAA